MPELNGPFCFAFLSWTNSFSASHCFCSASLAYCALARKVPGGFLLSFSWALCTLFCCWISSGSPYCSLERSASSSLGRSLVLLRVSCPPKREGLTRTLPAGSPGPSTPSEGMSLACQIPKGWLVPSTSE